MNVHVTLKGRMVTTLAKRAEEALIDLTGVPKGALVECVPTMGTKTTGHASQTRGWFVSEWTNGGWHEHVSVSHLVCWGAGRPAQAQARVRQAKADSQSQVSAVADTCVRAQCFREWVRSSD